MFIEKHQPAYNSINNTATLGFGLIGKSSPKRTCAKVLLTSNFSDKRAALSKPVFLLDLFDIFSFCEIIYRFS